MADPGPVAPELLAAVRGVAIAARRIERELTGMSLGQMRILTLIERDPLRANALADRAALSRPTLTGLLDGLATRGWIDRHAVEGDRRGITLAITGAGRRALAQAHAEAATGLTDLLEDLPEPERRAAIAALGAIPEALRQCHGRDDHSGTRS
jgi:DNA-binding MarR family transcriptional regulator